MVKLANWQNEQNEMVNLTNWQNEQNEMVRLANWQNEQNEMVTLAFCQFANFTISFCQQNGQNGKIDTDILHSAHSADSASLLSLPFHSASRMGIIMGRIGKSTKTFVILLILLILPVC